MNECSTPGTVCNTSGTQHHRHARAAIVNAAASMMYHRGVAATSIGDVSHASGAEVRELDRHFRDKTELVRAVIDRAIINPPCTAATIDWANLSGSDCRVS
ncbi:TetR family transcriptional regulator [Mycobacteroides abscessus]|uniref:TetR family transcriptional regulator n=1 Tax=Mycobacteroides abscessus TaxID=36809 RepID=UPI000943DDA6